jgi:hypothetical protein
MQHAPPTDLIRRALRLHICRHCFLRPPRSRWMGADTSRACERHCAIFATLPQVCEIVRYLDPMVEPYEMALRHYYDGIYNGHPCAHPARDPLHCDPRALHRYETRVVKLLRRIFENAT